jgi:plasmid stabilization system protein ParE
MAFRVAYSEQASIDLDEIIGYIHDELHSPQAAEKFYRRVMETVKTLRDNPYLFPLYHDEKLSAEGYHYVMVGNYMMFYVIDDIAKAVSIARIVYGRRNIPAIKIKS